MAHGKRMAKICVMLFVVLSMLGGAKQAGAATTTWEMLTAATGGAWFNTAASLAELVNNQKIGLVIKVLPGGGVSNPGAIGSGGAECGWIYPLHGLAAVNGTSPYTEKYPDLTSVVGGFSQQYCMFGTTANSGITDVKAALTSGKPIRILTGNASTVTGWLLTRILEFYGTSVEAIEKTGGTVLYMGYSDWPQLVQDGHADLFFEHSTLPSTAFQEIQTSRDIVLLDMPAELISHIKTTYSYVDCVVPAGAHKGQTKDIPTVGTQNLFAVNKNVSPELVTAFLDVLAANEDKVRAIHPSWSHWTLAEGWKSLGAPLHPAAEAWYVKKGMKK